MMASATTNYFLPLSVLFLRLVRLVGRLRTVGCGAMFGADVGVPDSVWEDAAKCEDRSLDSTAARLPWETARDRLTLGERISLTTSMTGSS